MLLKVMPQQAPPEAAAASTEAPPANDAAPASPVAGDDNDLTPTRRNVLDENIEKAARGVKSRIKRQASSKRIGQLNEDAHAIRRWSYKIVIHPWFDRIIVALIVINCIILALNDPLDDDRTSTRSKIVDESELFFTIVFTIEMVLKMLALGLKAYFGDRWNWIDFVVVVTGYVSMAPGVDNFSALRTFRVLRPLRTLTSIPGMRVIVQSMLASIPALFNVFLMCLFIFFVFGIIGVQLWNGVLRGRCAVESGGVPEMSLPETLCALPCDDSDHCTVTFGDSCGPAIGTGADQVCAPFVNPGMGFASFDNIGVACLTIFTSITLEGWVDVMYNLNATWGVPIFNAVYFILLIMFGSFFMLNLALAVIWEEYVKADEAEQEKQAELERLELEEELEYQRELAEAEAALHDPEMKPVIEMTRLGSGGITDASDKAVDAATAANTAANAAATAAAASAAAATTATTSAAASALTTASGAAKASTDSALVHPVGSRRSSMATRSTLRSHGKLPVVHRGLSPFYELVTTKWFNALIVGAILANTLVLALEHHGASDAFQDGLTIANLFFTALFLLEMILKLLGLGVRGYLASKFNVFDGVIVIVSVLELVLEWANVVSGGSGLSALRSFRLLRVFRLARSWKDLQVLLTTIVNSIADVANASVVLLIIMFIFVLLGMQLFGGQFPTDGEGTPISNAHFDNIWWAFVTVFQVLTGENWNEVLYTSMDAVGSGAVVYFVLLNIIGNYLILNLFLAILLGNFESIDEDGNEKPHGRRSSMVSLSAAPLASGAGGALVARAAAVAAAADRREREAIAAIEADAAAAGTGLEAKSTDGPMSPKVAPMTSASGSPPAGGGGGGNGGGGVGNPKSGRMQLMTPPKVRPEDMESKTPQDHRVPALREAATGVPTPPRSPNTFGPYGVGVNTVSASAVSVSAASVPGSSRVSTPRGGGGQGDGSASSAQYNQPLIPEEEGEGSGSGSSSSKPLVPGLAPPVSAALEEGITPSGGPDDRAVTPLNVPQRDGNGNGNGNGSTTNDTNGKGDNNAEASSTALIPRETSKVMVSPRTRQNGMRPQDLPNDHSLFVFSRTSGLRVACARLASHRYFEWFILALIAVSSVLLALDEPRVERCKETTCTDLFDFLFIADVIITSLFTLEMVVKVIAWGFVIGKTTYLRNPWNVLDFIIVVVSLLSLGLGGSSQLKALRSLRALRALRPLRVVSRYPGLKLVVNSIFGALPRVQNVALVNLLFFIIFAIVGVQNWAGAVNSCNDGSIDTKAACVGTWTISHVDDCGQLPTADRISMCEDCFDPVSGEPPFQPGCNVANLEFVRYWGSHELGPANFDNTPRALLVVFEVATGEMWPDIMYVTVAAVGPDEPMVRDHNPAAALYFIMINVVVSFFMLEIFTGVIIDNFNKMKAESQGSALLTKSQQLWVESMKLMLSSRPTRQVTLPANASKPRKLLFKVSTAKCFEIFIMSLIIANTVFMASRHADQPRYWDDSLDYINLGFSVVFGLEAVIKIAGLGPRTYFSIGWNRFDFTLVVASFVGLVASLPSVATLFRVFRVLRIFRLVRTSKGVLQLLRTLLFSIPSLLNVGAILLLTYFIFAIIGMNLFADIKHGELLNPDANFDGFFISMITLFRMSTGESYNGIMHDCMVETPFCSPTEDNCGYPVFAPIYFVFFYVLTAFILLNLLVAIILDNFSDTVALDSEQDMFVMTSERLTQFQQEWGRLDPLATKFIPATAMQGFICKLDYPLGLRNTPGVEHGASMRTAANKKLRELDIPEYDGRVAYDEVMLVLTKAANGNPVLPEAIEQDIESRKTKVRHESQYTLADNVAAQLLQAVFRAHRARKSPRMRRVVEMRMERHRRDKIRRARLIAEGLDPDEPQHRVQFADDVEAEDYRRSVSGTAADEGRGAGRSAASNPQRSSEGEGASVQTEEMNP